MSAFVTTRTEALGLQPRPMHVEAVALDWRTAMTRMRSIHRQVRRHMSVLLWPRMIVFEPCG